MKSPAKNPKIYTIDVVTPPGVGGNQLNYNNPRKQSSFQPNNFHSQPYSNIPIVIERPESDAGSDGTFVIIPPCDHPSHHSCHACHQQNFQQKEVLPEKRKTRDLTIGVLFIIFIGSLSWAIADIAIWKKGDPNILLKGYDNFGNICGERNDPIQGVPESGMNMTSKKFLMITVYRNISLRTSCVSSCPPKEFLVSIFNRCLPRDSPIKLPAMLVLDALNVSRSVVEAVISDTAVCWKEVTYSASISFVISLLVLILLRFVAGLVIWFSLLGMSMASALGTIYVWIRWRVQRDRLMVMTTLNPERFEQQRVTDHWFTAALTASVLWVVFVLVILILRKRIQLAAKLFREAGRGIASMPALLLQPFWTFFLLCGVSVAWFVGLLYLQSARVPVRDVKSGFVSYQMKDNYVYLKWPYFFALLWVCHFLVACQHFIVSSSIARWYFARPKSDLESPIAGSYWILIRYSFGSIALGSLFVSGIKFIRLLFKRIESFLSRYENSSCLGIVKVCHGCLWIFQKIVIYINMNAYVEMALTGRSFCSSARRAFSILSMNAFKVATVNSVGDFLLFLSKILIVLITLWTGAKLVEDRELELTYSWSPLIVSGLAAYFVAHCFLSVYEMAIDALLICFCEDKRANDGVTKPFFMSRALIDIDSENSSL